MIITPTVGNVCFGKSSHRANRFRKVANVLKQSGHYLYIRPSLILSNLPFLSHQPFYTMIPFSYFHNFLLILYAAGE